jgi:hypothetical protein
MCNTLLGVEVVLMKGLAKATIGGALRGGAWPLAGATVDERDGVCTVRLYVATPSLKLEATGTGATLLEALEDLRAQVCGGVRVAA